MPRRKTQFINEEYYHIVLRSVGDTPVFLDENDYFRAIFSLYEFNNSKNIIIFNRRRDRARFKSKVRKNSVISGITPISNGSDIITKDDREKFVEILAFVIMPNHIHILVKQVEDNGISNFMRKFSGLANYFNKKYSRKGHLFCTFQSVHIEDDEQLRNVFIYIHCNPISLIEPGWKENGIKDFKKVIKFLQNKFRWSSFFDYIGKKNFPSMTQRDFLLETFGGIEGCKDLVENWITYKLKLGKFNFSGVDLE